MSGSELAVSLTVAAAGAAAAAALVIAAGIDWARRVIPDGCSAMVAATAFLSLVALPPAAALGHLLLAILLLTLGAWAFRGGHLGGGDVKLLSAAGLWAGPAGFPALLLAQAAATILLVGTHVAGGTRLLGGARDLPFGVAIAAGGLAAILGRVGLWAGG